MLCACNDAKSGCFFCACANAQQKSEKRKRKTKLDNRFNWAHFPFTPITKIQCFFLALATFFFRNIDQNKTKKEQKTKKGLKIIKNSKCDCTDDADDASSACPNSESRSSVLLRSCDDESRDRFTFSFERLRSRPRNAAAAAKMVGSRFLMPAASRSGLMPCCARYKSMLFIRFCGGGGVKWLFDRRSSEMSHGTDVDVCRWWCNVYLCDRRWSVSIKKRDKIEIRTITE